MKIKCLHPVEHSGFRLQDHAACSDWWALVDTQVELSLHKLYFSPKNNSAANI